MHRQNGRGILMSFISMVAPGAETGWISAQMLRPELGKWKRTEFTVIFIKLRKLYWKSPSYNIK